MLFLALVTAVAGEFVNRNVLQALDTFQAYTRQSFQIDIVNEGDVPEQVYSFLVPAEREKHLAFLESRDPGSAGPLDVHIGHSERSEFVQYDIVLSEPVAPGAEYSFGVLMAYADGAEPRPRTAPQGGDQYMLYSGLRTYPSKYDTVEQLTKMAMTADHYSFHDELGDESTELDAEGFLNFGPYNNVGKYEVKKLKIRYNNPTPQVRVRELQRTLWVSHFGQTLSFEEAYDVQNVGTELEGPFSRYEFMRATMAAQQGISAGLSSSAIRGFRLPLPKGHREEFYVDLVGNVSTSQVGVGALDILPRYPIMGGWFYNFTVGFGTDLANFVRRTTGSNYILEVPLVTGPEYASYDKVVVKFVLPEGASNIEVISPVKFDKALDSKTYSYLDLFGQPTVELHFSNVVYEMSEQTLVVSYNYGTLAALRKPAAYAALVFALLAGAKALRV